MLLNGHLAQHISHVQAEDEVLVDGLALPSPEPKQLWLYHKPQGIDCNLNPIKADSLYHVLATTRARLHPVGRLDKDSCGLLLLTNDGELTQRLLHPDFEHPKTYWVKTTPQPTQMQLHELSQGVRWQVGPHHYQAKPCRVWPLPEGFGIELTQGLNRQIRYMSRSVGLKVVFLKRLTLGSISLEDTQEGQMKQLSNECYYALRQSLGLANHGH